MQGTAGTGVRTASAHLPWPRHLGVREQRRWGHHLGDANSPAPWESRRTDTDNSDWQHRAFLTQVQRAAARAAEPMPAGIQHRVLKKGQADRAGLLVTFVPPAAGDPVRSVEDGRFYIRSGDELVPMPYEVLKRMFAGASGLDIQPLFDGRLVRANEDEWEIPFLVGNNTSATGRDVQVNIEIENPEACDTVRSSGLSDVSAISFRSCGEEIPLSAPSVP
jgi:hypothetical protein